MKILGNFFFISLVGFMLSCQLVLNIEIPKQPDKLAVNSILVSDCVMTVAVSRSLDILDTTGFFEPVQNATIIFSDELGNKINFTSYTDHYNNEKYRSTKFPQPGKLYTMKVIVQGFESVESIARFPDLVENIEAFIDSANIHDRQVPVEVKFSDHPDQRNYYETYLVRKMQKANYWNHNGQLEIYYDTLWERNRIYYEYIDHQDYKSLFSDTYCNNQECALKGFVLPNYIGEDLEVLEASVEVLNISPEYYEYLTTSHLQGDIYDDPTAQPVQVFNNIQNGYGIFAGYSKSVYKIK